MKRGIELIFGPMFCGKTSELLTRLRRYQIAGMRMQLFKPIIDIRYSQERVVTHCGQGLEAIPVRNTKDLVDHLHPATQIIGIDEIQFFDGPIVDFCLDYSTEHLVLAAGLQLNFRREPFRFRYSRLHMGDLMPHCVVSQIPAVCTFQDSLGHTCGEEAWYTQRLKPNGQPASYWEPVLKIGGNDIYEARCRSHHFLVIPKSRR